MKLLSAGVSSRALGGARILLVLASSRNNPLAPGEWTTGASHKTFAVIQKDEDEAMGELLNLICGPRDVFARKLKNLPH